MSECAAVLERPPTIRLRPNAGKRQWPFLRSPATFRAFVGGRGSGKTYAGSYAALIEAITWPRSLGIIVAPTYPMITDDVVPVFCKLAAEVKSPDGCFLAGLNRSELRAELRNGSSVLFRSIGNAEHVQRLRGVSASWVWVDEAAHAAEGEQAWKILIATLREGGRMGRAWLTTTPRGRDWIYNAFVLSGNHDYKLFHSRTDENEFTLAEYKRTVAEAYGVGWFARQELGGEFCDPEGALFRREWFRVVDSTPPLVDTVRAWDLAVTTKAASDYTAGVKMGIDDDGMIYVLDVIRGKWEWPEGERVIVNACLSDGPLTWVYVETVAFQAAVPQSLNRRPELASYAINEWKPLRDKLSNAIPFASKAQAGRIAIVSGAWNAAWLDELCSFDGTQNAHDDQVDASSIAYHAVSQAQPVITVM